MKKILLIAGLVLSSLGIAQAAPGDIESWNIPATTVPAVTITSSGQITMTDGIVSFHETFNVPTVSSIAVLMARVSTATLIAQGTYYTNLSTFPAIIQPIYPIALIAQIWTDGGNATSNGLRTATETVRATLFVSGINAKGGVQTTSFTVSTTPALGFAPFAKISSISITGFSSIASTETLNSVAPVLYLTIGSTGTLGIAADIDSTADVFKVKAFGVDTSSYTVNPALDTFTFSNPCNGIGTLLEIWGRHIYSAPRRNH